MVQHGSIPFVQCVVLTHALSYRISVLCTNRTGGNFHETGTDARSSLMLFSYLSTCTEVVSILQWAIRGGRNFASGGLVTGVGQLGAIQGLLVKTMPPPVDGWAGWYLDVHTQHTVTGHQKGTQTVLIIS